MTRSLMIAALLVAGTAVGGAAVEPEAQVAGAVLDHSVEPGDALAAADLVEQLMAPGLARGTLRSRDIDGMEAARRLPAGSVMRATDIVRPQLVRRGEPVTIVIRSGGLVISTMGRALASGAAGASVRVVTNSTSRTLDAIVDGPGTVRVVANLG
jgi:flagella basal body P-ring formation protein FlgA